MECKSLPDSPGYWAFEGKWRTLEKGEPFREIVEVRLCPKHNILEADIGNDWEPVAKWNGKWWKIITPWDGVPESK